MKRTVIKGCTGGGVTHHKKRNGLMQMHRLAAAQGCLLSSDVNTGEAPRRQIFYFFDLMVGGGWAYFSLYFSTAIPLGIPPVFVRRKLLHVLRLPEQLDSWKDWRCRRVCGCITLPHRVSQFWSFVWITQDFANNKRTEAGEDNYIKCVLGCTNE